MDGSFCVIPKQLRRGLEIGKLRMNGGELERKCTCCGEYLPADTSFFYLRKKGGDMLQARCCFCQDEAAETRRLARLQRNRTRAPNAPAQATAKAAHDAGN